MKWDKYIIKTTPASVDAIGGLLIQVGISGFQIEDDELECGKNTAYVSFYLAVDDGEVNTSLLNDGIGIDEDNLYVDEEAVLTKLRKGILRLQEYMDIGEGSIAKDRTQEEDWANNWKQFFKPFAVEDMLIEPSWEKVEDTTGFQTIIEIDPGNAFGSGTHETTKLCLKAVHKMLHEGDKVLDLGCGSGILSIAAKKLGADSCVAVDIDPLAVENAKENTLRNAISEEEIQCYFGNVLEDTFLGGKIEKEGYDFLVANILAEVIIMMAPLLPKYIKKGGYFATSGILYTKQEEVLRALRVAGGLEVTTISQEGDWVGICGRRME